MKEKKKKFQEIVKLYYNENQYNLKTTNGAQKKNASKKI